MSVSRNVLVLTVAAVAAVAALTFGPAAEARVRGGRARSERVHSRTKLATAASVRVARLEVQRRGLQHQSINLQIAGAPAGEAMIVFIADASGVLQPVGSMRAHGRSGRTAWGVKTGRGDALPFGVPDVAFLSGRAVEVRSTTGVVLADGVLPTAKKATGISRKMKTLKQGLAVDSALAGVSARIVFRRGEHGRPDRFAIRVEGAAPGLTLDAWLIGADGASVDMGALTENAGEGDDEGDDDGEHAGGDDDGDDDEGGTSGPGKSGSASSDDDGDTDDDDDGADASGAATSEYEFDLDSTAALPFGAASLADLAGLALEIRNAADASVVASGLVPDTSAPGDEADDDDDDGDDDDSTGGDGEDD